MILYFQNRDFQPTNILAKFEIVDKKIPQKLFEIMKPAEGISLDIKGDINIEKNIEV